MTGPANWAGDMNRAAITALAEDFNTRVASTAAWAQAAVKGGRYGKHPSLADRDDGNLKHTVDFRRVHATMIDRWLGLDASAVLRGKSDTFDRIA